jgi:hypothetical protein
VRVAAVDLAVGDDGFAGQVRCLRDVVSGTF